MIRTLHIENGLEWRVFKYEFESADDALEHTQKSSHERSANNDVV